MSVNATSKPAFEPLALRDPRFPLGFWHVQVLKAGDASAGGNTLICQWSATTEENIFSLEDYSVDVSVATLAATTVDINFNVQMRTNENRSLYFAHSVIIPLGAFNSQSPYYIPKIKFTPRKSTAWTLEAFLANVNGTTAKLNAWGYYWSSMAYKFIGGPLRPGEFAP